MIQYKLLAGLVLIAAALSGTFMAGYMVAEGRQAKLELVASKAATEAATIAAKAIAAIDVKQVTINNKVKEIIKTELLYTECRHTEEAYHQILEKFK